MANSFANIAGIFLFVLACKNINKTYKDKSIFLRVGICIGLFFISMILAGLFLFTINPNASPGSIGENSIIFLGLFADIISLILRFFRAKKRHKKESKEYKSARNELILSIVIPLVIFIALFGFDFFKKASCGYPKMMIGDECCAPNTDFGIPVCLSEAQKMNEQLNNAVENDILTKEQKETIMNKFTILVPEKYYAIRDIKAGYFDIPLFLVSYWENGEAIMIRVMYSENANYGDSIHEFYDGFKKGADKSAPNAKYSEPAFFQNGKNNFEVAVFNMTANVAGTTTYSSQAIIKSGDEILIISYLSENKELFEYYYYEFENILWSADRV